MKNRIMASVNKVVSAMEQYPFQDPMAYANWAAQAYFFVRHSTPMLALSAGLSVDNNPYHVRCIKHLSEEKGHEKMLLNDLKANGFRIENFRELSSTQALYQTQYYWIQHKSPRSFLGYIALLEGLAVTFGATLKTKVSGHKGAGFIEVHAEDDVDHIEKAFAEIEALTPYEQELVAANAELAGDLYIAMLEELSAMKLANLKSA